MATKNWLPIFKTGRHVSSSNKPYEATIEKLDKIVAANQGKEVPITIGHPKGPFTQFGLASELKRVGGMLYARPSKVDAEFESWVNGGFLQGRSISVNEDGTLNHIGFTGEKAPAVQLPPYQFAAPDTAMAFEFSAADMQVSAVDKLKALFTDALSILGSADPFEMAAPAAGAKNYPDVPGTMFMDEKNRKYPIDPQHIHAAMSYWADPKNRADYSPEEVKTMTDRMLAAAKKQGIEVDPKKWEFAQGGDDMDEKEKQELVQLRERNKTLEQSAAAERKARQRQEFSAFLEGKHTVKVGDKDMQIDMKEKVSPAMRGDILGLMEFAAGTESFEFAAPDGSTVKKSPLEILKTVILPNLKDQVTATEFARHDNAGKKTTEVQEVVAGIASASPKETK